MANKKDKTVFVCQNCGFETWGKTFGREISDEEFRILFRDSAAGPYDGFISMKKATKGKPFSGYLLFDGAKVYVGEEVICGRQMLRSDYITLAEQGRTEELEGFKIPVFTILTRPASEELRFLHDRMPLILPKEDIPRWLDPAAKPEELVPHAVTDLIYEQGSLAI